MSSIYQEIILDHYKSPHNYGELSDPSCAIHIDNPSCGDKIHLSGTIKDGILTDVAFTGQGCAISIASSSLLTDYIKGKKVSDLKKLDTSIILELLGIELSPNRLKCALLPLEALGKLLSNVSKANPTD
ncbi:MAG: SUF system NifU family Fe-S cluster assembly protein [Microgenomates group bacterium]